MHVIEVKLYYYHWILKFLPCSSLWMHVHEKPLVHYKLIKWAWVIPHAKVATWTTEKKATKTLTFDAPCPGDQASKEICNQTTWESVFCFRCCNGVRNFLTHKLPSYSWPLLGKHFPTMISDLSNRTIRLHFIILACKESCLNFHEIIMV